MSDMSSLSHEYASTTDFSHHVNQAVLLLKKRYHGSEFDRLDAEELANAASLIQRIVVRLLQRLGAHDGDDQTGDGSPVIPEDILIRLEEKQCGNLEYLIDDLTQLRKSLAHGSDLNAVELELLDSICEVADASASATFRKLGRR